MSMSRMAAAELEVCPSVSKAQVLFSEPAHLEVPELSAKNASQKEILTWSGKTFQGPVAVLLLCNYKKGNTMYRTRNVNKTDGISELVLIPCWKWIPEKRSFV